MVSLVELKISGSAVKRLFKANFDNVFSLFNFCKFARLSPTSTFDLLPSLFDKEHIGDANFCSKIGNRRST